jgi:hypothetical protein
MKRKTIFFKPMLKGLFTFSVIGTLVSNALNVNAQTIVTPANPDNLITTVSNNASFSINCDMITSPSAGLIKAITWIDPGGVELYVFDGNGNSVLFNVSGEAGTDVVIADDLNNPGVDYIVGLIFQDLSGNTEFDTYSLTGTGSSSINLSLLEHQTYTGSTNFPHIDIFGDPTSLINGRPTLNKYVLTYGSGSTVNAVYGDIASITTGTTSQVIYTNLAGQTVRPDVAASYNVATAKSTAYFSIEAGSSGLFYGAWYVGGSSPTTTNLSTLTTFLPRIEAMNVYDTTTSNPKQYPWTIIAPLLTGSSTLTEIFSNGFPTGFNCDATGAAPGGGLQCAIAAGVGAPTYSSYSDLNYTVGWYAAGPRRYLSRAVDYSAGAMSSIYPNYYQVNTAANPVAAKESFSLSGCSNSGDSLLAAWYGTGPINASDIYYKLSGDITSFKPGPTAIQSVPQLGNFNLYPNPSGEVVNIVGDPSFKMKKITVYNVLGKMVYSSEPDATDKHSIQLDALAAGTYTVDIYTDKGTIARKLEVVK